MKNNIDSTHNYSFEPEMVKREFYRILNKKLHNKNITYSEFIFMTIFSDFLMQ